MNKGMLKKLTLLSVVVLAVSVYYFYDEEKVPPRAKFVKTAKHKEGGPKANPNAVYWEMRAYPYDDIDIRAYERGIDQANKHKEDILNRKDPKSWEFVGPENVGGRISDIVIDHQDENIIWAATASGGVYKSVDGGVSWTAVFDDQPVLTIGAIDVEHTNSNIAYVGTGEASASSFSFYGNGIYRTMDGGLTWEHIGLENSSYISRVRTDPNNPGTLYVCATGKLYSADENKGVYKSTDYGETWQKILYISDITAANDIVINPDDSNVIYASMWERIRTLDNRISGGVTSGIYKSVDAGENWTKLTNGFPDDASVGRIGLAIGQNDPNILYAAMANYIPGQGSLLGGVYRSDDGGVSWMNKSHYSLEDCYSNFGWYFSKIEVDPKDDMKAYLLGVSYHLSTDGGDSWQSLGGYNEYYSGTGPHVDHHAIAISKTKNFFINGNDGGIITSGDQGATFSMIDLPISQFYGFDVDDNDSKKIAGGTQDNGTNMTVTGGSNDWTHILGGDGFRSLFNPVNSNIMYAEAQWGYMCKSIDGGNYFWRIDSGIGDYDRFDWNTPIVFHPSNSSVIYCGSQYVYRSVNASDDNYTFTWTKISPDLSDGIDNVYAIAPAPSNERVIYAGTSHGGVWLTQNGGSSWTDISSSLPDRWVTGIAVSWTDPASAYVSFSGLRWDEELRYVYKTTDYGSSWTDVTGDLPLLPINCIEIHKENHDLVFVGSDIGFYYTADGGATWSAAALGLPNAPVYDIDIHYAEGTVYAATYGRSIYKIPLNTFSGIEESESVLPGSVGISNYPNPFNNETSISIELKEASEVNVKIYNSSGREITTLHSGQLNKGINRIRFDAGKLKLASGIYICRAITPKGVATHKLNYLR
jgi:photosystem II stability/assembly factor-like uncharacterized protein